MPRWPQSPQIDRRLAVDGANDVGEVVNLDPAMTADEGLGTAVLSTYVGRYVARRPAEGDSAILAGKSPDADIRVSIS